MRRIFRRLFPGPMGEDACAELERQRDDVRARRGALIAWIWYVRHLFSIDTWKLARALRRSGRAGGAAEHARLRRASPLVSVLDLKLAVRMLFKHPGLTVIGWLAMSISIALGVGCFSYFQDYFLRPTVPLPEGDRIVSLGLRDAESGRTERRVLHDFSVWREELRSIQDVGAWRSVERNLVQPAGGAELVTVAEMSASGFRVARTPPLLGRPLVDADEAESAPPVVVIGYDVWTTRYGGDPDVLGRTMQLGRVVHTIVGVMPEGFGFPLAEQYWAPLRWNPTQHAPLEGSGRSFVFGRLAPGATLESAEAEVTAISLRRAEELPDTHSQLRGRVMQYTDTHTGMDDVSGSGMMVVRAALILATLILTIPFANVAILVYARTANRAGEMSVRSALGATRSRVVTLLFLEALALAALSTVAGVAFALYAMERLHVVFALEFGASPFWATGGQDPVTMAYAVTLAVLAAVVAGVLPGLKATGARIRPSLSGPAAGNGMRLGGTWTALIVVQVGLSVSVLPAAASFAWHSFGFGIIRPTFPTEGLLSALLSATSSDDESGAPEDGAAESSAGVEELIRRLEAEPGVSAVTHASALPGELFDPQTMIEVDALASDSLGFRVGWYSVAPDFFDVLGVSVASGRSFAEADLAGDAVPVIVNRAFVTQILANGNAVGRRLRSSGYAEGEAPPWHEIVGVVEELAVNPVDPDPALPRVFVPAAAAGLSRAYLVMRATTPEVADRVRVLTGAVDPTLRLESVQPLGNLDNPIRSLVRTAGLAISLSVLTVVLLSTAGIYALMSFNVTQRRREIGIRSALGAEPGRLLAGVFSRIGAQLGAGVLVGVVGAVLVDRVVSAAIMPWPPLGRGAFVGVTALMLAVAALAAWGPARKGLRIGPMEALRND